MYRVRLVNENVTVSVTGGTLAQACAAAGYPIEQVCGGRGACGKCRVEISRGSVRETVLACRETVLGDVEVYLTPEQASRQVAIVTEGEAAWNRVLCPQVSKCCRTRRELVPEHGRACLPGGEPAVLRRFARLMGEPDLDRMTFVYAGDRLLEVEPGDTAGQLYGAAVDIGTTTLVLYACDLLHGKLCRTESALNGQAVWGADVVSRIRHALEEPGGLEELHESLLRDINSLLEKTGRELPGFLENLYHIVLCGNSVMQHLFWGLHPGGLAGEPFCTVTAAPVRAAAEAAGLTAVPARCLVEFLPLLGGFVGADTTAALISLPEEREDCLLVDLGTNGEIALKRRGRYIVASTACGPALEGGSIACGMRGAPGAVERVSLRDGQVRLEVIGGGPARGLCGSGILDATAELLRAGILDSTGRMRTREEYCREYPHSPLAEHMGCDKRGERAFFFTRGDRPVYLTQHDVRQVQLAKSAIRAGCEALLEREGMRPAEVTALYLAGAFGSCADVDNALYLGLLPPVFREKIHSVGNAAGVGARLCLLDRRQLERAKALPAQTEHVELAASPRFSEGYIQFMGF